MPDLSANVDITIEFARIEPPASSITIDLGTETNIDSTFTISGGVNNMNSIVNSDGVITTPATTITVIDPEATEVASGSFSVSATSENNVDAVGNFINTAVNNNTESPIDFISEYGSGVLTLTAREAGNTNPWTIVINNNGATAANQGNLSTSSVQTGYILNQVSPLSVGTITGIGSPNSYIKLDSSGIQAEISSSVTYIDGTNGVFIRNSSIENIMTGLISTTIFNFNRIAKDFTIRKNTSGDAYNYNAVTDVTTIDSDTINVVGNTITGVAGSETGTWTPAFTNTGMVSNFSTTYSKSGQNVIVEYEGFYCYAR